MSCSRTSLPSTRTWPLVGIDQPVDHLDQRGLAAARLAEHGDQLARHAQRDAPDRPPLIARAVAPGRPRRARSRRRAKLPQLVLATPLASRSSRAVPREPSAAPLATAFEDADRSRAATLAGLVCRTRLGGLAYCRILRHVSDEARDRSEISSSRMDRTPRLLARNGGSPSGDVVLVTALCWNPIYSAPTEEKTAVTLMAWTTRR